MLCRRLPCTPSPPSPPSPRQEGPQCTRNPDPSVHDRTPPHGSGLANHLGAHAAFPAAARPPVRPPSRPPARHSASAAASRVNYPHGEEPAICTTQAFTRAPPACLRASQSAPKQTKASQGKPQQAKASHATAVHSARSDSETTRVPSIRISVTPRCPRQLLGPSAASYPNILGVPFFCDGMSKAKTKH